jgi:tetratricopeptide (TPR) repeat protein
VRRAGAGALMLVVTLTGGCAAHRSVAMSSSLIHRGKSDSAATFDAPGAEAAAERKKATTRAKPHAIPLPPAQAKSSIGLTAESSDPALGRVLRALGTHPTASAERDVAAEYRRLRIYDRAYTHLEKARALEPRNAGVFDDLARTWRDAGAPALALPDAWRAVFFAPKSAEAHNTLGTVLFALGDVAQARQQFEAAVALAPEAEYARRNLCVLVSRQASGPVPNGCDMTALALAVPGAPADAVPQPQPEVGRPQ